MPQKETDAEEGHKIELSLKALGVSTPIKLAGADAQSTIDFSFHTLDIVRKLQVRVGYSYFSMPASSSLKVRLNGQEVASLQLPEGAVALGESVVDINPMLLQEWNQLTFHFAPHLGQCDDPRIPSLVLNNNKTSIDAVAVTLPLTNDLALFPVPFFDRHDARDLQLPFVFSEQPSWDVLKSAGILASWFGHLAEWRKAQFPAYLNSLPAQDAIVLATSGEHIDGIQLPQITDGSATISIVAHPHNPNARLLLVVGRSDRDLVEAAQAISLGQVALAGESVSVQHVDLPKRSPFDAPKWLALNKKTRLADLVPADQLKKKELFISPLQVNLNLPPGLHRGSAATVPFNLMFESSNTSRHLNKIEAAINGIPFQSVSFDKAKIPGMTKGEALLNIPMKHITGRDTLTVHFTFAQSGANKCEVVYDEISIDPESTIDLRAATHYMELPDLSYLAYNGYPFSKMADLSETAVLLPDQPDRFEIEGMLAVLGHVGNKTGYPATALTVASIREVKKFAAKDLLVVGAVGRLKPFLEDWKENIQINVLADSQPYPHLDIRYPERWPVRLIEWSVLSAELKLNKGKGTMVMVAFQSPLQAKRSVVMLTADSTLGLPLEASVLNTFKKAKDFSGDVVTISGAGEGERVTAFHFASKFVVGELPLIERVKGLVQHNPFWAMLVALVVAVLFASMVYRRLKRLSEDKLKQWDNTK